MALALPARPAVIGRLVDMAGAFDPDVHSYPSLVPRLSDDLDLTGAHRAAGFGGFVLKGHHESTASRAYLLGRLFPDLRIVAGIVLHRFVGGLNPAAVEACLRTGGRMVWMPSIDADGHARAFGRTGGYDAQQSGLAGEPRGISIFDDDDKIRAAVFKILDLVKAAGALPVTAHLSASEVTALVPVFAQSLFELGMTEDGIALIIRANPCALFGLDNHN